MKCWIVAGIDLILIGKDDLPFLHQYCAKGLIAVGHSGSGQRNGFFHEIFVIHSVVSPYIFPSSGNGVTGRCTPLCVPMIFSMQATLYHRPNL